MSETALVDFWVPGIFYWLDYGLKVCHRGKLTSKSYITLYRT